MVNTQINTYINSILSTRIQWAWNWAYNTWKDTTGSTVYIKPVHYFTYGGGAFAFIMAMVGSLQTASQTVQWIEDGMDDFLEVFSTEDNQFKEALAQAHQSDQMSQLLQWYTLDLTVYTMFSFWHAAMIIFMAYFTTNYAFSKLADWEIIYGADIPINNGVRSMLFSTLLGSLYLISGRLVGDEQE